MMWKAAPRRIAAVVVLLVCATAPSWAQGIAGKVTGAGSITVDGGILQRSADVRNGSIIATAADADATIDLGALGKIEMRPNTLIRLAAGAGGLEVTVALCGSITQTVPAGVNSLLLFSPAKKAQLAVTRGVVTVDRENGERKSFAAGRQALLYKLSGIGVSGGGETAFTITCSQGNFFDKVSK